MAFYSTNEFKGGLKVLLDGEPHTITENEFVKPGKGQAFNRVKFRNLKTGRIIERTMKSGDSVEAADVVEQEMHYLYNDGTTWHFMNQESFEQYEIAEETLADAKMWLKEQDVCQVTLWNNQAIAISPPNFVIQRVVLTDPGVRGDTSGGGGKPATLEGGAVVRVPLFIQTGELVRVDTRTGEYMVRVKE